MASSTSGSGNIEVKPVPKEKPKKNIWHKIKDVVKGTKKEVTKDSKVVYDETGKAIGEAFDQR